MDLFKTINSILSLGSTVTIVIAKGKTEGQLTSSVAFKDNTLADAAKDVIAPFVVSGTPEELDNEFVGCIKTPLEQSHGLQTSMKQFEDSQKKAKAQSAAAAAEKKKVEDLKKKNKDNFTKFSEAGKKAKEAKKWSEALKNFTEALKYASDDAEKTKIQKEIAFCKANNTPSMFDFDEPSEPETTEETTTETEEDSEEADDPENESGEIEDEEPEDGIDIDLDDMDAA